MTRAGESYRLPTPFGFKELRAWIIFGSEFSLRLPTLQTADATGGPTRMNTNGNVKKYEGINSLAGMAELNIWPEHVSDSENRSVMKMVCRLPTVTVCGNYNRKGASATSGDGLATALKRLPTPTVGGGHNRKMPKNFAVTKTGIIRHLNAEGVQSQIRLNQQIAHGGPLNPEWSEWFMGWPIGWTGLKPLETGKFRQWLRSHGEHCSDNAGRTV